jgi:hypothetical protein
MTKPQPVGAGQPPPNSSGGSLNSVPGSGVPMVVVVALATPANKSDPTIARAATAKYLFLNASSSGGFTAKV